MCKCIAAGTVLLVLHLHLSIITQIGPLVTSSSGAAQGEMEVCPCISSGLHLSPHPKLPGTSPHMGGPGSRLFLPLLPHQSQLPEPLTSPPAQSLPHHSHPKGNINPQLELVQHFFSSSLFLLTAQVIVKAKHSSGEADRGVGQESPDPSSTSICAFPEDRGGWQEAPCMQQPLSQHRCCCELAR